MIWEEAVEILRNDPTQQKLVRDCFYDDPLLGAAQRYYESEEWSSVRELVGCAGGRALDVGAGRGISTFALAKDGWQVTAVEPDPSDIVGSGAIRSVAEEAGLRVDIVSTTGERLPFEDGTFDLVYGRAVIHHAVSLPRFCSELVRVLKPGGQLLATREHVINHKSELATFLASHPLHRFYGGENAYLLSEYVAALANAGLKLTQVMNPLASPINYAPMTREELEMAVARRLRIPAALIGTLLLRFAGRFMKSPGRLFSFYGVRQ